MRRCTMMQRRSFGEETGRVVVRLRKTGCRGGRRAFRHGRNQTSESLADGDAERSRRGHIGVTVNILKRRIEVL